MMSGSRNMLYMAGMIAALAGIVHGQPARASAIYFNTPANCAAATDVSTAGSLNYAYTWSSTQTVNGVTFAFTNVGNGAIGANLLLANFGSPNTNAFNSGVDPFASLPAEYKAMLIGSVYRGSAGTGTVTLNGLTAGKQYAVQVWVGDPRAGSTTTRTETITSSGGNTQTLDFNVGDVEGGVGQSTIGYFTASGASHSFDITGGAVAQMNAMQLREVTGAVGTWGGGSGVWDETTPNFTGQSFATVKAAYPIVVFGDVDGNGIPVTATDVTVAAGGAWMDGVVSFTNTAGGVNYTINSDDGIGITGAAQVSLDGSGTVTFAGANTYTGGTNINGGTLRIAGTDRLPIGTGVTIADAAGATLDLNASAQTVRWLAGGGATGGTVLNSGGAAGVLTLDLLNSGARTFAGAIQGDLQVVVQNNWTKNSDTQVFTGVNSYTGGTVIDNGQLRIAEDSALGAVPAAFQADNIVLRNGGILQNNNTDPVLHANRGIELQNGGGVIYAGWNKSITVNGAITGVGGLTKHDSGNLVLSGDAANDYTGVTVLRQGYLYLDKTAAVAIPAGTIMQMGAGTADQPHLRMMQSNQFGEGVVMTFANAQNNWARFDLQGTTQTLAGLSSATAALQGGVIQNERLNGGGTSAPGTLIIDNDWDYSYWGYIRDEDDGGTLYKLNLVKNGTGTQEIIGDRVNHTGTTTINGGTLKLTNVTAYRSPTVVNADGTLVLYGTGSWGLGAGATVTGDGTWQVTGPGVSGQGHFDVNNDMSGFTGSLTISNARYMADAPNELPSGSIDVTPGGQVYLTAASTYSRDVSVAGNGWLEGVGQLGAVRFQGGAVLAGNVTLTGNTRLTAYGAGDSGAVRGVISGPYALEKTGSGTLTLAGDAANTYGGVTTLMQGAVYLSKPANVVAVPGNLVMDNNLSPDVYTTADNQFGPGAILSFTNNAGDHGRLELMGTTQTLAGVETVGYTVQRGVIQNMEMGPLNTGASTLVLDGAGTYTFTGYLRNGSGGTLGLRKTGDGTQIFTGNQINYTGPTTVNGGTLRLVDATGFVSPTTVNAGGTLVWHGNGNWGAGAGATVSGNGTWQITGSGTSDQGHFDVNNDMSGFTGSLTISNARYQADAHNELPSGSIDVTPGGQIFITTARIYNRDVTLAGNGWQEGAGQLGAMRFGGGANWAGNITLAGNTRFTAHAAGDWGAISGVISGDYNVEKTGAGLLTLAGDNTYTGTTTVNGGTLALDNGRIGGGGAVSVAANSTLAGRGGITGPVALAGNTQLIPGSAGKAGTLALADDLTLDATTISRFELGATPTIGGGVNDYVSVGKTLAPNGSTIALGFLAAPANGAYRLFDYAASTGAFNPALTIAATTRKTFALDETAAGEVNVMVSGGDYANLTWTGGADSNWDVAATFNWDNTGSPDQFYDLDSVRFDAAGAAQSIVTVVGTVQPAAIAVNYDGDYTFSGAGKIGGPAGIVKSGTGTLTLGNTGGNDFLGGVTINQGVVKLGTGTGLPANATVTVADGAAFDFAGQIANASRNYSFVIAGAGPTGAGAMVNNGAEIGAYASVANLKLSADASVGGTGRWDIGTGAAGYSLDGGGFVLTKVGGNEITVRPEFIKNLAAVEVQAGLLKYEAFSQTTAATAATTHRVAAGATLGTYGTITLNMPVVMNGGTLQSFNGTGTWSGGVLLNTDTVVNSSGGNVVLSGAVSGAGALTKIGGNALTLSGSSANTYAGLTTVNNGGGTLILGKTSGLAIPGNLKIGNMGSGSAVVQLAGAGQISETATITFAADWGNWSYLKLMGNNLTVPGIYTTTTPGVRSGGVIENVEGESGYGPAVLTVNNATDMVYDGHMRSRTGGNSGTLGLTKTGAGTLTLVNAQITHNGVTTVNAGTLVLQDTTGFASPTVVNAGATLNAVRTALGVGGRSPIMGNGISGTGTININNAGSGLAGGWTTVNGATGSMTFSGTLNINSGVFSRDNTQVDTIKSTATVNVAEGAAFGAGRGGNSTIGALNGAGYVSTLWGGANVGSITVGNGGGSGTFTGVISGNGTNGTDGTLEGGILSLIKTGAGTQTLTNANTYSGTTRVQEGKLVLANALAAQSSTLNLAATDAGALLFSGGTQFTLGGLQGTRELVLENIEDEPIELRVGNNNANLTFSGSLSGAGSFTKIGNSPFYLDGNNTYTGATTAASSYLVLKSSTALAGTSEVTVQSGATLQLEKGLADVTVAGKTVTLSGLGVGGTRGALASWTGNNAWDGEIVLATDSSIYVQADTFTVGGVIGGGFGLTKNGGGTLTLAGANAYAGATIVGVGTLKLAAADALPVSTVVTMGQNDANNATFDLNGSDQSIAGLMLSSTGGTKNVTSTAPATLTIDSFGDYSYGGVLSGDGLALVKSGWGTQTLNNGGNTYGGGTVVEAGMLKLFGSNNGYSTVGAGSLTILSGAVVEANSHNTLGQATGTHLTPLVVDGGTFLADQYNHINSVTMTGGEVGVRAGVAQVDGMFFRTRNAVPPTVTTNASDSTATISSKSTLFDTTTFTIADGDAAEDLLVTGPIVGAGLVKAGPGLMALSGVNTYGGGTTVNAGTLRIDAANALPAGGALTIGASGTLVLGQGLSAAAASSQSVAAVPEPSTIVLLAAALVAMLAGLYRRHK